MDQLLDWTEQYIKNKDLTLRKIVSTKKDPTQGTLDVRYKDKQVMHYTMIALSDKVFELTAQNKIIVCLNTKDNFNFLVKHWTKLAQQKNMSMIFVSDGDKWLINPYVHNMIADPDSLESGLKAMFDAANGDIREPKIEKKKPQIFDDDVATEE